MKRTFTINLNNTVYHIDNDAYELLQQYLSELESRLSPDEKKEVMTDIEARISELFSERLQKGKNVINMQDVEEMIQVLGKPNQINEEEDKDQKMKSEKRYKRKFYRDPDNAILGGVASGLASLLGWDVILVRILLVIIILLGWGTIIPIYLILWLIVPPAKTISQKLEMQGEDVTAEKIKEEINKLKNYVESDKFKESATGVGNKLGEIFRGVFKVIFGFVGAMMGLVGFILVGVLILILSFLIFEPAVLSDFTPEFGVLTAEKAVLMIISLILIVGIPIFSLIYWAVKILSRKKYQPGPLNWILVVLWFIGIFMFAGLSAKTALMFSKGEFNGMEFYWSNDQTGYLDEMRTVDTFNGIEVSGNIKLDLQQDTVQSVQISCHPNMLGFVKTEVEQGVLKIYSDKIHLNNKIKATVHVKEMQQISGYGATEIHTRGKVQTEQLLVELSGMSKADLDLSVSQDLVINVEGASKVNISGHAYKVISEIYGASRLDAGELMVRNASINGSGASHIEMNVADSLLIEMSGASKFKTEKRPAYIKQHLSGVSSIVVD